MSTVSFYLRPSADVKISKIYCYASWDNDYVRAKTGEKCRTAEWSGNRIRRSGDGAAMVNENLNALELRIEKYLGECRKLQADPDLTEIKQLISGKRQAGNLVKLMDEFIEEMKTGRYKSKQKKHISAGSIKTYQVTHDGLKKFFEIKGVVSTRQVTDRVISDWQDYQWTELNYRDGNVSNRAQHYNSFAAWASKKGFPMPKAPFWKEDKRTTVVFPDELKLMREWCPEDEWTTYVRDIFLFGCMTGLRVTSLLSLKPTNVIQAGGVYGLHLIQKGDKPIKIKLPGAAFEIMKDRLSDTLIFPGISQRELNTALTVMGRAFAEHVKKNNLKTTNNWCGQVLRYKYVRGKPIEEIKDFCETLTPHTMRRSCATGLLTLGVPKAITSKHTGHAPNSQAFDRYESISQEHIDTQVTDAWDQVFK